MGCSRPGCFLVVVTVFLAGCVAAADDKTEDDEGSECVGPPKEAQFVCDICEYDSKNPQYVVLDKLDSTTPTPTAIAPNINTNRTFISAALTLPDGVRKRPPAQ
jgi:hypothetical protein